MTSRGGMRFKNGYYLELIAGGVTGTGEVSFIEDLSIDNIPELPEFLSKLLLKITEGLELPSDFFEGFPSVAFAFETAIKDYKNGGNGLLFQSDFVTGKRPIPINGLVWMGEKDFMMAQVKQKLEQGFKCVKLKIGALDFETEIELLQYIRNQFSAADIELRLDANGAFKKDDALEKLKVLSDFEIHSIEQPIRQKQWTSLAQLCRESPIPIALDEELIFCNTMERQRMLDEIKPTYIILKPSLLGGFSACDSWISLAQERGIGWWATSALESNIGLNAIAQWVATKDTKMVQGLGTGALYKTNTASPLHISNGNLQYRC